MGFLNKQTFVTSTRTPHISSHHTKNRQIELKTTLFTPNLQEKKQEKTLQYYSNIKHQNKNDS